MGLRELKSSISDENYKSTIWFDHDTPSGPLYHTAREKFILQTAYN